MIESQDLSKVLEFYDVIVISDIVKQFNVDERTVRKAVKNIVKKSNYEKRYISVFLNGKQRAYKRVELCTDEEIQRYCNEQTNHIKSTYFDTLKPIASYIKDENQRKMYDYQNLFNEDKNQ